MTASETAGTVTLAVRRTGGTVGTATVRYATTNVTATAGADYTLATGLLSFAAGETNKTFTVRVTNDTTPESDETFDVELSSPTGEATLGGVDTTTVTLTDNDCLLSLQTNAVTVLESAGSAVLTINRTGTLTGTNTLAYTIRPGTATAADYTATNGVLTFAPNATNATLTLPIVNDTTVESTEAFTVVLSNPSAGASLSGTNTAYITITENDVGLAFSAAVYSVGETATNVVLTVVQTGDVSASATVDYASADIGALDGSDYTAVSGTLNFGPGTNSVTISVPLTDDSILETNETFRVVLSNASGATLLTPSSALVRILEDDSTLSFSTNAVAVIENATTVTLTVLRSGGTNYAATVDWATTNLTATAGADYTATNATLTFTPGIRTRTITVPLSNDSSVEGDETFSVVLDGLTGATMGSVSNSVVTIRDNDSVIGFTTNAVTVAENAGTTTLTLTRTGGTAAAASVRVTTTNGTATASSDYTTRNIVVSFRAGETNKAVSVSILNDLVVESTESFTLGLSAATGEATLGTGVATISITDNDFNLGGDIVEQGVTSLGVTGLAWEPGLGVRIALEGPVGAAIILESSTDLVNWGVIGEAVLTGEAFQYVDLEARERAHSFYRVRQPVIPTGDEDSE